MGHDGWTVEDGTGDVDDEVGRGAGGWVEGWASESRNESTGKARKVSQMNA